MFKKTLILGIVLGMGLIGVWADNEAQKQKPINTKALINILLNEKEPVKKRVEAIGMLEETKEARRKDKVIMEALKKVIMEEKNDGIRGEANDALNRIKAGIFEEVGTPTKTLIKTLFDSKNPIKERIQSAKGLGTKKKDKEAIEALNKGLKDKNEKIQIECALGLYKLGKGSPTAISVLDGFLKKGHSDEILSRLFKHKDLGPVGEGGYHMYLTVGLYDEKSGKIILKNALKYENDVVRAGAANCLTWIGEEYELVHQTAIECLKNSKNVDARLLALHALAKIADERSLEAIKIGLNDKDEKVKERAQWLLNYIKNKEIQKKYDQRRKREVEQ